jgi:ABC-type dipeptide/oligopeptide/nickel transport system permease subunit
MEHAVAAPARAAARSADRASRGVLRLLTGSRLTLVGLLICVPIVTAALLGPLLTPHDPLAMNMSQRLAPPSLAHPMGTDAFGRDTLSRVIYGARVSLQVGAVSVALGLAAGFVLGTVAGYLGGTMDNLLMRFMDAVLAFPAILLALVLMAILGPGLFTVMTAIAAIRIPIFARTIRASVIAERERDYVEAARTIGQRHLLILMRHIVPNVISPVIVLATSYFASGIVVEASLSFLGLGVIPPDVSWGTMLSESREYMQDHPWTPFFPGLALSLAVLGFNLLGDGARDLLDPRLRTTL